MGMVSFLLQTITTTNGLKLAYQTISVNSAGILGSPNPDPPLQSWSFLSNPLLRLMLDGSPPLRLFTVTKWLSGFRARNLSALSCCSFSDGHSYVLISTHHVCWDNQEWDGPSELNL